MTAVTFAIAAAACLVALRVQPRVALCVYCAALFLYPQALTLQLGAADFSLSRIVILAVLINALVRHELYRSFAWSWIDTLLSASYGLGFVALLSTTGVAAIERHGGAFFDTLLPYFAARLIVTTEEDFITLVKGLALIALPLVALGLYQSVTGRNPVGDLSVYYRWGFAGQRVEDDIPRLGLYRAAVTFTHPAGFGLFCAMVAALTLSMWRASVWSKPTVTLLAAVACGGVFASLSSGPWLAVLSAAVVFIAYLRWRVAVRLMVFASIFVIGCAWYADRPFLDVIASLTLKPGNALYRGGLIGETFGGGMSGHWLTGYGYVGLGPGTDNTNFHWRHQDLVNFYILMLVRTGLLGLIPYLLANGLYYARLLEALARAASARTTWLAVSALAAMVGLNVGLMTVGALSQVVQLLYMAIAMSANMPAIATSRPQHGR